MQKRPSSIMGRLTKALVTALLMTMMEPLGAQAGAMEQTDRQLLRQWVQERNQAAGRYVALWLKGAPPQERAALGASILATEVHVATYTLGDMDILERYSLLWGKETTVQTLPIVILEKLYDVDLGVDRLFGEEGGE